MKTFQSNTSTFIPRNCQKTNAHSRINRSRQGCSQILKNKNCESSYADISRRLVKRYVIKAQVWFWVKNYHFCKKNIRKNYFKKFLGRERTRKYKWRWNSRDKTGIAFHLGFLDYFRSHFQSHFWAYYWSTVRSSTSGLILNFSPEHHFRS